MPLEVLLVAGRRCTDGGGILEYARSYPLSAGPSKPLPKSRSPQEKPMKTRNLRKYAFVLTAVVLVSSSVHVSAQEKLNPAGVEFFEKKIRPVLAEQCYRCHSAKANKVKAGLRLDTKSGMLKGGDSGPSLVPGQPGKSLLIKALRHVDDLHMPPSGKLPAGVVADFETWISIGRSRSARRCPGRSHGHRLERGPAILGVSGSRQASTAEGEGSDLAEKGRRLLPAGGDGQAAAQTGPARRPNWS